jgi:hypothetical protein
MRRDVTARETGEAKYAATGVAIVITQGCRQTPTPMPGSAYVKGRRYRECPATKSSFAHAESYVGANPRARFLPATHRTASRNFAGGKPGIISPFIEDSNRRAFSSGRKSLSDPSGWGNAFNPSKHPIPYCVV